jgi:2-C-methyl-D-erythritol 4-phosphate cytidylyltransferase
VNAVAAAGSLAVIIPAAGLSTRFGSNKLTADLDGTAVFVRSVQAFLQLPNNPVGEVIIAYPPHLQPVDVPLRDQLSDPRIRWIPGGPTRAHSVQAAAQAVSPEIEWLAIHDAARPLVSADLISRCITHAQTQGSAAPAMPVKLTIKEATGPLPAAVRRTVPRSDLWEMQTPQVMRRATLLAAYTACPIPLEQVTDDIQLLELTGQPAWLVPGEERNLKITTPQDLHLARLLLRGESAH